MVGNNSDLVQYGVQPRPRSQFGALDRTYVSEPDLGERSRHIWVRLHAISLKLGTIAGRMHLIRK